MINTGTTTYVSNGKTSYEEMARGMQEYIDDLKNGKYSKEQIKQDLIAAGILDKNGHTKKHIVTGY